MGRGVGGKPRRPRRRPWTSRVWARRPLPRVAVAAGRWPTADEYPPHPAQRILHPVYLELARVQTGRGRPWERVLYKCAHGHLRAGLHDFERLYILSVPDLLRCVSGARTVAVFGLGPLRAHPLLPLTWWWRNTATMRTRRGSPAPHPPLPESRSGQRPRQPQIPRPGRSWTAVIPTLAGAIHSLTDCMYRIFIGMYIPNGAISPLGMSPRRPGWPRSRQCVVHGPTASGGTHFHHPKCVQKTERSTGCMYRPSTSCSRIGACANLVLSPHHEFD